MFYDIFLYVLIYMTYKPILTGVDLHDNMYWLYAYVTLKNKHI